ncbi:MAG: hypothetical protein UX10_C0004G0038 [Candidatus Magasanikbacteria bacterium GW2011_GWA2_45_39]|uniref:CxxC-x17-CxxC domain-containing protein n=1 Tax=Candidatus Magasanikbacteria bacterium GW2011_GWA2_45_39 TaxID=1619041 RepID=A0A0G1QGY0_9BACT|nr:MAG: hypothetical protein UX10_C0004G0038 [Candidatus Magasanikbacteria bacterium GW2011_GWA2_45_39]
MQAYYMGNFNRDNGRSGEGGFNRGFGGGRPFGGGKKFGGGGRDGARPSMHQATCSECGSSCEVPFRPTGSRPVFCTNCFGKQGGGAVRPQRFERESHERPRFEDKRPVADSMSSSGPVVEQIKILNVKIDKLIEILTPKKKVETIEKPESEEVAVKIAQKKSSAKKKK